MNGERVLLQILTMWDERAATCALVKLICLSDALSTSQSSGVWCVGNAGMVCRVESLMGMQIIHIIRMEACGRIAAGASLEKVSLSNLYIFKPHFNDEVGMSMQCKLSAQQK